MRACLNVNAQHRALLDDVLLRFGKSLTERFRCTTLHCFGCLHRCISVFPLLPVNAKV